jgi:hypothetical protein
MLSKFSLSPFGLSPGGGYIVDQSGHVASPLEVLAERETLARDYVKLNQRVARLEKENGALGEWKEAVVDALNPLRQGDPIEAWGVNLGTPAGAVRVIEGMRREMAKLRASSRREE